MKYDKLNNGYLSHGILAKIYNVIDYLGYKFFPRKNLQIKDNNLLFINLGLIGDLILFRYAIENFLVLDYKITILIQAEYEFLFENLGLNDKLNIITISNYKDKQFFRGFFKIWHVLRKNKTVYDASLHFRGYLGTGILATYLAKVSRNLIGYGTSGFGFLLNKKIGWQVDCHETQHILNILQVIEPCYSQINLAIFDNYLLDCTLLINKYLAGCAYVVIHATSQDSKKNIPVQLLSEAITYILDNTKLYIVFVGSASETSYIKENIILQDMARIIIANGQTDLFDVYCLMSKAQILIGIDSSIAHLSSGLLLPKIIVWHHQNILEQWQPLGENFHIIEDLSTSDIIVKKLKELNLSCQTSSII